MDYLPDIEIDELTGKPKIVQLQQNSLVYSPLNRKLLYTKAEVDAKISSISSGSTPDATFSTSGKVKQQVYNVKDYGAKGDGTTDDTTAINAALTAASSTGGTVYVPQGTYIVSGTGTASDGCFVIPDNTIVTGAGMGSTIIKLTNGYSSDVTGIFRTKYNTQNTNITLRDLTIDGNGSTIPAGVRVIGFYCGTIPGSTTTDTNIGCINVKARFCTGYGFDPHERTTRLLLAYCISHDNGYGGNPYDGFTLDGQYEALVIGCVSYNNNRYGFNLTTASTNCTIIGCEAYSNTGGSLTIANGSKYTSVVGLKAHDNGADGIFINGIPNNAVGAIDTTPGVNNSIKGCEISTSGQHGIHVYGSQYNHVSGNKIIDSSQTTTNTYSQIFVDDDSGTNLSTFNTISDNDLTLSGVANISKYAIGEAHSTDDNNFYFGNRISGAYGTSNTNLLGATSKLLAAHNGVNEHNSLLSLTPTDGTTVTLGTSTGLQIGTASNQKLAFLGATPIIQQTVATDLGSVLASFGFRASGGTYALSTSAAVSFTGPMRLSFTTRSSGATLTAGTSAENQYIDATSGAITINLAATTTSGYKFTIKKIDSSVNAVTVNAGTGNTIDGSQTYALALQYKYVTVMSTGTSGVWYIVANN